MLRILVLAVVLGSLTFAQTVTTVQTVTTTTVACVYEGWAPPIDILTLELRDAYCMCPPVCDPCYEAKAVVASVAGGVFAANVLRSGGWELKGSVSVPACRREVSLTFSVPNDASAIGLNVWTGGRWVQSVDIYGINAVCPMILVPPKIDSVEVDGDFRIRVYVKAPASNNTLRVEVVGPTSFTQTKRINIGRFGGAACVTLRVDFGPYKLKPGNYKAKVVLETSLGRDEKEISFQVPDGCHTVTVTTTVTQTVTTTRTETYTETRYVPTTTILTVTQPTVITAPSPVVISQPAHTVTYTTTFTTTLIQVVREVDWTTAALLLMAVVGAFALGLFASRRT